MLIETTNGGELFEVIVPVAVSHVERHPYRVRADNARAANDAARAQARRDHPGMQLLDSSATRVSKPEPEPAAASTAIEYTVPAMTGDELAVFNASPMHPAVVAAREFAESVGAPLEHLDKAEIIRRAESADRG